MDLCKVMTLSNFFVIQGNSDEFIDANIQLVLAVARKLQEMKGTRTCIVSLITCYFFICFDRINFVFRMCAKCISISNFVSQCSFVISDSC